MIQALYMTFVLQLVANAIGAVYYPPENFAKPSFQSEYPDVAASARYEFKYGVRDSHTGQAFKHAEERQGDKASGSYEVALPDGRIQVVTYIADENGFVADVTYQDESQNVPFSYSATASKPLKNQRDTEKQYRGTYKYHTSRVNAENGNEYPRPRHYHPRPQNNEEEEEIQKISSVPLFRANVTRNLESFRDDNKVLSLQEHTEDLYSKELESSLPAKVESQNVTADSDLPEKVKQSESKDLVIAIEEAENNPHDESGTESILVVNEASNEDISVTTQLPATVDTTDPVFEDSDTAEPEIAKNAEDFKEMTINDELKGMMEDNVEHATLAEQEAQTDVKLSKIIGANNLPDDAKHKKLRPVYYSNYNYLLPYYRTAYAIPLYSAYRPSLYSRQYYYPSSHSHNRYNGYQQRYWSYPYQYQRGSGYRNPPYYPSRYY